MSDTKPKPSAKPSVGSKDRWGMRPAGRRFLRGRVVNLSETRKVTDFGELRLLEFGLDVVEGQPPVPVAIYAIEFSEGIGEGMVIDMLDPKPHVRPLQPYKIWHAHDHDRNPIIAHYPGRGEMAPGRSLLWTITVVALPALLTLAVMFVILRAFKF